MSTLTQVEPMFETFKVPSVPARLHAAGAGYRVGVLWGYARADTRADLDRQAAAILAAGVEREHRVRRPRTRRTDRPATASSCSGSRPGTWWWWRRWCRSGSRSAKHWAWFVMGRRASVSARSPGPC